MKFETKYSIGDKVWVAAGSNPRRPMQATIGQVNVQATNSPGIEGEDMFDNYKPQKGYVEKYMCIETGIGTGTLWQPELNLFATKEECTDKITLKGA